MPSPKPYNGTEPYIFISYARKDSDIVLPIMEHLQSMGVRLWYDEGITPSVDYADMIAKKLKGCAIYVSFLSDNFYASKYCKGELNYAHKNNKQILNIYLKNEPMPDGMSIWYDLYQCIFKYQFQDDHAFYQRIMDTENIAQCISSAPALPHSEKQADAQAIFERGMRNYEKGNYLEAAYYYKKAAELGHAEAQFEFANCYDCGHGVRQDFDARDEWYAKAVDSFLKLAEQDHPDAMYYLGVCFENELGISQNDDDAFFWYQRAAEMGHVAAQNALGRCYQNGIGTEKSAPVAAEWFRKAAEQGYPIAQYQLGFSLFWGTGVQKNQEQAIYWLQKSAKQGYPEAQFLLGYCYELGQGVIKNDQTAAYWYQKATEHGHKKSRNRLAQMKEQGLI